ncbi:MAG: malonyl-CoA synthase [Pseudomonadota bacterium]
MSNPLYDQLFGCYAGADSVFLHLPGGASLSHGAFVARAAQFAGALTAAGASAGDRVAVQVEKSAECLVTYAACAQAGLIFLPLNTAYTAEEVRYFAEDSGAKILICDAAKADALRAAIPNLRVETLNADGSGSLPDMAAGQPTEFATAVRGEDDLAAFLYTSGTTGRSKGAMLTQKNLLSNAEALAQLWQYTDRDTLLHALPIFHTHGLFVATNVMLLAGGSMIFLPKFDLDAMIAAMPQATSMMGVPTFYTRLLADDRFTKDLTANMRLFISGSAPLLAETHVAFEARTGHRILERYGMTETNMNTSNPFNGDRRAGTVGQPLPGVELRVMGDAGPLPAGEIGVIEVRGSNVFKGYWNMPDKTAAELRADGWFITGDLGFQSHDGYVTIVGRGKDLIISGGYNIYPKEVEEVIDAAPDVLESAVVAAPHPDLGEVAVAFVVPKATGFDAGVLQKILTTQLARFKHPREVIEIEALPRNTMGKVQKNLLRDQVVDRFRS